MNPSAWIIAAATLLLSASPVRAEPQANERANDMAQAVQDMALTVPDARNATGRDARGRTWAGVWMDEKQVCDQGRLNAAGSRIVQEGQRYSQDQGARLTLFTPPESAQAVRRDMAAIAPEAAVRPNALIGRHCYLVISK